MDYVIYKLHFSTPVHFGKNALSSSEYTLCSDTVFSALCTEAVRKDDGSLEGLVKAAREGKIQISDALPYINDDYLLPKPYTFVERKEENDSSVIRKAYKNLKYVSISDFDNYLSGSFDVTSAVSTDGLGVASLKISASIRNEEQETKPYEVGLFSFYPNSGLYIIAGTDDQETMSMMDDLMELLSSSGLGGKRSSGYGRFSYEKVEPAEWLTSKLNDTGSVMMLINTALPQEDELNSAMDGARYSLIKRSGFVASATYADSWQRKKDIVMFKSGSCFNKTFSGDIYDVSTEAGSHPVYRYGKPMFMRVSL
ncbi:MAG: type III-A CRISPR-associated RAMP protein Csm4 [Clostridiales bacterium]|nr:type III-A CRISPR-associated RAMP protein Csm4 [Clostridiales bacterium]